jgi:hypothetical protein
MARRSASPPSPGSPSKTPRRLASPACAGQILWIPKAEEVDRDLALEPGQYNHPCILLSHIPKDNGKHVILIVRLLHHRTVCKLSHGLIFGNAYADHFFRRKTTH